MNEPRFVEVSGIQSDQKFLVNTADISYVFQNRGGYVTIVMKNNGAIIKTVMNINPLRILLKIPTAV